MPNMGFEDKIRTSRGVNRIGFFARLKRGWQMTKLGMAVVRADPELMVYVVLSGIFSLVTSVVVIATSFGTELLFSSTSGGEDEVVLNTVNLVIVFVGYLLIGIITVFWNAAIVASAYERLTTGNNPTFSYGISQAMKCLPHIFIWGIISGTVGLIIKTLESMAQDAKFPLNLITSIIAILIGTAWWIATFFVVPLIVLEKTRVKESFSRSTQLFQKTWGENLGAACGAGIINFFVILVVLLIALPLISIGFVGIGIIVLILGIGLSMLFFTTVDSVSRASMYYYATTGELPPMAKQIGISFSS
tara:strand:+ start:625 stop:1536 length:912 start_codon:yes stop_codon:yes gene_type:complete